nr:uncharacterized protein LOC106685509 [Halyomorpha halys]
MFAAWSVCAILFASVFGARAAQLGDDPFIEKVKEIVAEVDDYLAATNQNELQIPDIDYPFSPLKIKNGAFGDFSTIELQDGASVKEKKLEDNSTVYSFDINVGLQELFFHYDFQVDTLVFKRAGNFSLSVQENSAKLTGLALVHSDKSCKAVLTKVKVLKYGNYQIDLQPNDFPQATVISQQILNFVTPFLLPFSNAALEASLFVPQVQQAFSEFTCKKITS